MNLRQAQEQARRAVLAYLTHTASLPSGNLLSNLDMLARAQFLEGLVGHPWGTVANKASGAGVRGLTRAVSRMLLEVDPMVDPAASTWTDVGSSGLFKSAWGAANSVVKAYGLDASDVIAEDMAEALMETARGSLFYLAGKAFKEKAQDIVSGAIEIGELSPRIIRFAKNLAINVVKHKKVQDKADANAVAEGMLPDGNEEGDFNADTMDMGSLGAVIAVVLANPREPAAQEVFDWMRDWVDETSRLSDLEKSIVGTYLTDLATTGSSTSATQLAADFGVTGGFISQLMSPGTLKKVPAVDEHGKPLSDGWGKPRMDTVTVNMGRFPTLVAQVLKSERPSFLDDLDNLRELAALARGGGGAWKAASANKVAAAEKILRAKLIRLASEKPELRPILLPLLVTAGKSVPSKPKHIASSDGSKTLCGIAKDKAVKQDLPVVSQKDAGQIEASSLWCPKCVTAAEKDGVKVNKKADQEPILAGRPWGGKGYKPKAKDYDDASPGPGSPPCTPEGEGGCYEHTDMYKGYGSANAGSNGSAARREYNKKYKENM